ncbi:TetR family transcriptional regulator [Mycobacteroides chelonae]|jgi:TetR/AcrR family transcriptional regulator, cholesterol catabolism regulator|uniref:TetR family transcriptional regulator n=1 Tax=Mycobacteroides chelonae TaxID=1774 RepID=A0A1S1M108_MYCCH|nr:TetR family transcriptional regulator [Mycobacteroides chelonae]OHU65060.1 TetR family transcriptional regulator [Mycobacteroides chelonae]OHU76558.1 TetR family transcriptional regulator [Mycobacteroides chelonae]QQG87905.1 TetR/AcrR family transcriptional regulator [Mycobacteroides chelonae]QQG92722.1 TetR/AcrR family transcriptional regulator [Mycobacteroides chelonae]
MPSASRGREPASPSTPAQKARCDRILSVAAKLGARQGLEAVRMQEVADRSEVSTATLYRYYPTKHHLFAALLFRYSQHPSLPAKPSGCPITDATELMVQMVRSTLAVPLLAKAMIVSVNVLRAESEFARDFQVRRSILAVAGKSAPTAEDAQLALLVEQMAFGVLCWAVMGETTPDQAERNMRKACALLLAPWRGAAE